MPTEQTSLFQDLLQFFARDPGIDIAIDPITGEILAKPRKPFIDRIAYGGKNRERAEELELLSKIAPIESRARVREAIEKEEGISGIREREAEAGVGRDIRKEEAATKRQIFVDKSKSAQDQRNASALSKQGSEQRINEDEAKSLIALLGQRIENMSPTDQAIARQFLTELLKSGVAQKQQLMTSANTSMVGDEAEKNRLAILRDFMMDPAGIRTTIRCFFHCPE